MGRRLEPDPDALNPLIQNMASIETKFQGSSAGAGGLNNASAAVSKINEVRQDMGRWEGVFQENFVDNFVTPLQGVSTNMRIVAIELLNKSIEAVQLLNNQK